MGDMKYEYGYPTPQLRPDPTHVKRPALFLDMSGFRCGGEPQGTVVFSGLGRITRAAMRDLIAAFQEWDQEPDV